jgi:hypothetical protein
MNNDGKAELVTAPRSNGGPNLRLYTYYQSLTPINAFWAYDQSFFGGVNLAIGRR